MRISATSSTRYPIITNLLVRAESISSEDFPKGFIFGTASSAYQFAGAVEEGNQGDSIWDTYSGKPGRILDFSNADMAVDQYHRFQVNLEDTFVDFNFTLPIFGRHIWCMFIYVEKHRIRILHKS